MSPRTEFGYDRLTAGRAQKTLVPEHAVLHRAMVPPFPQSCAWSAFAMGCFWGVERLFWEMDGVWVTAAGYAGGTTQQPSYEQVCSGRTGHAETVLVVYEPARLSYQQLLKAFWENHDPTQGMRQHADIGTQYRSAIFHATEAQRLEAEASLVAYARQLTEDGLPGITTVIEPLEAFYYAENYHQQYLWKNPQGYCGLKGTGVSCLL